MAHRWLDIESAPKDGTRIILYRKGRIVCGRWDDDRLNRRPRPFWTHDNIRIFGSTDARSVPPTHWMPLPTPPHGGSDETV